MNAQGNIIFYHYPGSPYSRKILWYLALRGIQYKECIQSHVMPRPDLELLNIQYRRIPLMSIGRDVYCDTRLILRKLEELFPQGRLGPSDPDGQAVRHLLERYTTDAGIFGRAGSLIPSSSPIMKDPKFLQDRTEFSGREWSARKQDQARPESLAYMRDYFDLLEHTFLADGRDWILKTSTPSLADIDAIWVFDWMVSLKALDPKNTSTKTHPRLFAWLDRFKSAVKQAASNAKKPERLSGRDAAQDIVNAAFVESSDRVDPDDPIALQSGSTVQVWPIDTGFSRRDQGRLVLLTSREVAIAVKTSIDDTEIHLHMPRWGFRIAASKPTARI